VLALEMPPLRHRKEDIPLLIDHFLQHHPEAGITIRDIPSVLLTTLSNYHWPGNVRELFNEVRRYIATGEVELNGETVPLHDASDAALISINPEGRPLQSIIEDLEKHLITRTLGQYSGNKMQTAKALQMSLRTLHRKIKKYTL
jgi:DNA-binding NtrC family response regulator